VDLPYDSSQVEAYGESFKEWGEQEIKKCVRILNTALTLAPWTLVVLISLFGNIPYAL